MYKYIPSFLDLVPTPTSPIPPLYISAERRAELPVLDMGEASTALEELWYVPQSCLTLCDPMDCSRLLCSVSPRDYSDSCPLSQ